MNCKFILMATMVNRTKEFGHNVTFFHFLSQSVIHNDLEHSSASFFASSTNEGCKNDCAKRDNIWHGSKWLLLMLREKNANGYFNNLRHVQPHVLHLLK